MKTGNITPRDENGKPHGYWERYYTNGNLSYKGYYVHGYEYGYWESYYYSGQLDFKGLYFHRKIHGYWERYCIDGQLKRKTYFYCNKKIYQTSKDKFIL